MWRNGGQYPYCTLCGRIGKWDYEPIIPARGEGLFYAYTYAFPTKECAHTEEQVKTYRRMQYDDLIKRTQEPMGQTQEGKEQDE